MKMYQTWRPVLEWIKLALSSPVEDNRVHNPTGLLKVEETLDLLSYS